LEQAVHRLAALPAENLKLDRRGRLAAGYFADVVVFDPARIRDTATYAQPHSYAEGVRDVLVNGVPVLRDGEHTNARPGRVIRGPGWRAARKAGGASSLLHHLPGRIPDAPPQVAVGVLEVAAIAAVEGALGGLHDLGAGAAGLCHDGVNLLLAVDVVADGEVCHARPLNGQARVAGDAGSRPDSESQASL